MGKDVRNGEGLAQDPVCNKSGVVHELPVRAFCDVGGDGLGVSRELTGKLDQSVNAVFLGACLQTLGPGDVLPATSDELQLGLRVCLPDKALADLGAEPREGLECPQMLPDGIQGLLSPA